MCSAGPCGGVPRGRINRRPGDRARRRRRRPVSPRRDLPSAREGTVDDESSGQQYRFILPGPRLTPRQAKCLEELRYAARSAEMVVASGSLPPGVPSDFYQRVADICRELGVLLILDTSGGGLEHITSGAFLLKPSVRELRECFGRELATESEQLTARTSSSTLASVRPLSSPWAPRARCWLPAWQPTFLGSSGAVGQRRRRG